MGNRRDYMIAFVGLKPGIHEYDYEIDDKFFEDFGEQDFNKTKVHIKLKLDKKTSFMMLKFEVNGTVEVTCDRCRNPLQMQLWDEFDMLVKMVDNPDQMNETEGDPDVFYISRSESHIDVKDWLYEFISLSLPMQKMCNEQEMGGPQCNQEVLKKLKELQSGNEHNANALWKGLEKLKGNIS